MLKTFEQFIFDTNNNSTFNIKSRSSWISINESQESKSQSAAIKLVMDKFGWDYQKANKFVREDLRNDITALRDKNIAKFTLGVTRMYGDGELKDTSIISNLNATLKLLSAHLNEYDRNLNGLSADELISKFERTRQNNISKEKQEINRIKFGVSDYEIVKIYSFNDAKKYYKYTNPSSRWCLTHMEDMFDSYTCDGMNQIYFCLKHGFEDVKPIVGENAPLDEYGLSMLSIIVNEEGELAYCTTRWNHANGGNDSAMDSVEISKVVNVNFYEVFKPNTKWKDIVNNAKNRLENGESPKDVFDYVYDFKDGYAIVQLKGKMNFINKNGELLSDKWFDDALDFSEGYAEVYLNGKWNLINKNCEYLSNKWFDDVDNFKYGYARVRLNKKYNFINKNGEIILDKWFDYVGEFKNGHAQVRLNDKYNFINKNGEFLSDTWFDNVEDFRESYACVKLNDKWNFINTDGEYLSDTWFDNAWDFKDGYARVVLNDKWNFINTDGEYLSDTWFDKVEDFNEGYANVKLNKKYNFINKNGDIISDTWFDYVDDFSEGYVRVLLNKKYNFINKNGEFLSDKWFDYVGNFKDGYAGVRLNDRLNDKHNFINKNGEIISDTWFDFVYYFSEGYSIVKLNDKYNFINKNGEIMSDKWFDSYMDVKKYLDNLLKK